MMPDGYDYVLLPGRHHLLTRFQAAYLRGLLTSRETDIDGRPIRLTDGASVVWAVTSANHQNTRRNPIPYDRREAAIERFSSEEGIRSLVVPVFDTRPTPRFAEITLKNVDNATAGAVRLHPRNTVVACSTPEVVAMYEELGFRIAPVELGHPDSPARPWDVLSAMTEGGDGWRELAHPASIDVFERYRLVEQVRLVAADPVVGDEGGLTETRQYRTYVEAFDRSAARKWAQAAPYVVPGRILDIGCASGATLELADRDPRLHESDLIGLEVARHLFEECVHKKAQGYFSNPNVFFYQRNILLGSVFPDRSIDTTLTFALTHEIWSYGDRRDSIEAFVRTVFRHTAPGGVWINSDVCAPDQPDRLVVLRLAADGVAADAPVDLEGRTMADVLDYIETLSTRARLTQFAHDFARNTGVALPYEERTDGSVLIRLGDAMEFLSKKDYTDNWLSESHEQFCGLTFGDWRELVEAEGFELDPVSGPWRNDWIVDHRFAPCASLETVDGQPVGWPVTHVFLVARRPLNS